MAKRKKELWEKSPKEIHEAIVNAAFSLFLRNYPNMNLPETFSLQTRKSESKKDYTYHSVTPIELMAILVPKNLKFRTTEVYRKFDNICHRNSVKVSEALLKSKQGYPCFFTGSIDYRNRPLREIIDSRVSSHEHLNRVNHHCEIITRFGRCISAAFFENGVIPVGYSNITRTPDNTFLLDDFSFNKETAQEHWWFVINSHIDLYSENYLFKINDFINMGNLRTVTGVRNITAFMNRPLGIKTDCNLLFPHYRRKGEPNSSTPVIESIPEPDLDYTPNLMKFHKFIQKRQKIPRL